MTVDPSFKANPVSVVATTIDEETGEEKKRLINKMRWQGYGPASILYSEKEVSSHFSCVAQVDSSRPSFIGAKTRTSTLRESSRPVRSKASEEVGRCETLFDCTSVPTHSITAPPRETHMDPSGPVQPIHACGSQGYSQVRLPHYSTTLRLSLIHITPSTSSKVMLPLSCYVFQDGPWRDTMIRFCYDPRLDKEAR